MQRMMVMAYEDSGRRPKPGLNSPTLTGRGERVGDAPRGERWSPWSPQADLALEDSRTINVVSAVRPLRQRPLPANSSVRRRGASQTVGDAARGAEERLGQPTELSSRSARVAPHPAHWARFPAPGPARPTRSGSGPGRASKNDTPRLALAPSSHWPIVPTGSDSGAWRHPRTGCQGTTPRGAGRGRRVPATAALTARLNSANVPASARRSGRRASCGPVPRRTARRCSTDDQRSPRGICGPRETSPWRPR